MTGDTPVVPPMIQAWVRQLLDPAFVAAVTAMPTGRVDVKLTASKGRVSREPTVVLNGGPQEWADL